MLGGVSLLMMERVWRGTSFICAVIASVGVCVFEEEGPEEGGDAEDVGGVVVSVLVRAVGLRLDPAAGLGMVRTGLRLRVLC